jgi:glycosyltransferase involved in cell wall biosynthesis
MAMRADNPADSCGLRWLIVEDALRDRTGHWFEYISTFVRGLRELGDDVTVLADREAEPFIREGLSAQPVLPRSIWHRMNDKGGLLARYARVPIHAWQTVASLAAHLRQRGNYDIIFVPTVLVHHLLGWTWLIKRSWIGRNSKIVLFFPNAPISCNSQSGAVSWNGSPTTRLLRYLFRSLAKEVQAGRVVLGAETRPMQEALSKLSGVPFTYLPHPVEGLKMTNDECRRQPQQHPGEISRLPLTNDTRHSTFDIRHSAHPEELVLGSYGPARDEKGSDTLFAAVDRLCRGGEAGRCRFALQCLGGFESERRPLEGNGRIDWLTRYFADGEYARQLAITDIMLLPYRLGSYQLRVSRVAIEAMVNGIPIIATRGSTLASQGAEFGAVVACEDNDPASLAAAIQQATKDCTILAEKARAAVPAARKHFSVKHFREILLTAGADRTDCH